MKWEKLQHQLMGLFWGESMSHARDKISPVPGPQQSIVCETAAAGTKAASTQHRRFTRRDYEFSCGTACRCGCAYGHGKLVCARY